MKNIDKNKVKLLGTRHITVYHKQIEKAGVYTSDYCSKILLMGKWVRACGFEPEDMLRVRVYANKLVIKKEKPAIVKQRLLAKAQKAADKSLKETVKDVVGEDLFDALYFKKTEIKVKE